MPASSVPSLQFTPAGLILPQEADILAGVTVDINAAFGGKLSAALETPQGQLASSLTKIIGDKNDQTVNLVNQVDPAYADGRMQDGIARIYFLTRIPGAPTLVQCTCVGAAGTVIPVGAQAQDTSGNLYLCTQAGTITNTGTITLAFANALNGAIACPAGTLTKIRQAIAGWDTITNVADGVFGNDVESRAAFEHRRQQSVALNSTGWAQAVSAAAFNVPGVLDVYVQGNSTGSSQNYGATTYAIAAHSIYVAVVGGDPAAIAQAIWTKIAPGCDFIGNTTVTVTDPNYQLPLPTYTVKFNIPSAQSILFAVQIANDITLPSNVVAVVKSALLAAFNGQDGGERARIGSLMLASRYYAPVQLAVPNARILSLLLGHSAATLTNYLLGIDQQPTLTAANITVTLV